MYVCMYSCMYACVYVYVCMYTEDEKRPTFNNILDNLLLYLIVSKNYIIFVYDCISNDLLI